MSSSETANLNILLADDTPEHRELLVMALAGDRPDVRVTAVSSGMEAREALEADRFHCVVLDYNLCDFQAPQLMELIRGSTAGCPVIVVSTSTEQWTAIEVFRKGAADFIPKGIAMTTNELWESIQRALSARGDDMRQRAAG